MLIDTHKTISYKCSFCGSDHFININFFNLQSQGEQAYSCRCSNSSVVIRFEDARNMSLCAPCFGCGEVHRHYLPLRKLLKSELIKLDCPVTGIEQIFFGNEENVRSALDEQQEKMRELVDSLGYDSYFNNPEVMLQTVNRIHEIAAAGNMVCECGSHDIELCLLKDKAKLVCRKCGAHKYIPAANSGELINTLKCTYIILTNEFISENDVYCNI